jgi:hypothetical protein
MKEAIMQWRVLLAITIVVAGCGDSGPDSGSYTGAWQLTSVNAQPLPSPSNIVDRLWVAGVLQLDQQTGSYDWCWEDPATSARSSESDFVVIAPISGDRLEVSYFGRREAVPDTATVDGSQLSLRFRSVLVGGQVTGVDVLTFVPLTGEVPAACSLAP